MNIQLILNEKCFYTPPHGYCISWKRATRASYNSCDHYYILYHVLTLTKSVLKPGCALDTQWITLVEEIQNFSPSRHTLYPRPDWKMKQWWLMSVILKQVCTKSQPWDIFTLLNVVYFSSIFCHFSLDFHSCFLYYLSEMYLGLSPVQSHKTILQ